MGRLIVTEFVSLDGVMEAPGGEPTHPHAGWTMDFMGPQQMDYKMREGEAAEVLLLGRVTYEGFAAAWPQRSGDPFSDKFNAMPKHVVTSTLSDLEWNNSHVLAGRVEESVPRLKEEVGGEIQVHGSASLVHALLLGGLVDELRLMVFPVALGSGKRVFPETERKLTYTRTGAESFDTGVSVLTYTPS